MTEQERREFNALSKRIDDCMATRVDYARFWELDAKDRGYA
jgi:hypothetical protein